MESQSVLKKTMLASLGIYSLTKEKAQDVMNDLVKRGELSKDEGAKFVKALMDKADEEVAHLKQLVDKQVNQAVSKIMPTQQELKKLNEKLDKLTKEVEKLTKSAAPK
jgi:polyhydroxyalkanoate synthesis regulator phasin